jgi:hypothetical protein
MGEVIRDQDVKNECSNQPEKCEEWSDCGHEGNSGFPTAPRDPIPRIKEEAKRRDAGSDHAGRPKE